MLYKAYTLYENVGKGITENNSGDDEKNKEMSQYE